MELSIKQTIALDLLEDKTTNEVLFGGGAGGGKTALGCYWQLKQRLKYPNTRGLIGRAVLKTLKETTLVSLFQVAKMQGLFADTHYKYNAQMSQIEFFNGSVILLKDLYSYPSDPNFDELGSLEITDAFIDEANQIEDKARNIIKSRIRYQLDENDLVPKILYTCNPAKNWTYHEFYKPQLDKFFNPAWNVTGNELYGQSPLMAAARTLTRSNEAKTAAVASFQNGGPAGVLFMNDDRFDPTSGTQQAQALKKAVSEKGGSANFNSIAVSGYKVDWKQIGLSPVELNIIESEKWDMKSLCNIYGVPSQLLNDADNKTYNNQREGEKALTLRCAIPLLDAITENLNRKLHSDWGYRGTNIYVGYDIQVYQELEANKTEQVDWLDKAWWIPPAQKLEIMGIKAPDYVPAEELEKIYVPSNVPVS